MSTAINFKTPCSYSSVLKTRWNHGWGPCSSKVRVGAYDSHEDGYEVAITKKVPHPSYNRDKGRANDVMLISIETTTPHPFIKLCREKVTDGRLTVIGFGSTASIGREISPTLLEVEVDYVDNTRCDDGHGGNGEISEDMMCARKRDRDACKSCDWRSYQ